ncbi:MAG TPA: phosphatidylglycerol lysyltransferase domain-containing protein, partial [Acidimicrobiales bacterium]|nr:phosphatidylglycerol lysyltransferase domain-containing protein [Acidimicrobiales bacterium]
MTELILPPRTEPAPAGATALAEVQVPVGARVLVVSDLRLGAGPQTSRQAALVRAVESWTGPGALVFNGNTFDFPAEKGCLRDAGVAAGARPARGTVANLLETHGHLAQAVRAFAAGSAHRVVVVPGERDAYLAWSAPEQEAVRARFGAEVALAVDLDVDTGAGVRRVRVEVGYQLDRLTRHRVRHPVDSPAAHDLPCDIGLSAGSRGRRDQPLSGPPLGKAGPERKRDARDRARVLISSGYAGLVTGGTGRPELVDLGRGFLASAGSSGRMVTDVGGRRPGLGLPPVFVAHRPASWVEMEAGNELYVRLLYARRPALGATALEQLVSLRSRQFRSGRDLPQVVATCPRGRSWPEQPSDQFRRRRIRRLAALFVGGAGLISLVSALSVPLRGRLHLLRQLVPLAVPETATALTALAAVGLLVLARGVRRGQRRAWAVTLAALAAAVVGNLVKGVDFEEATVAAAVAVFLWANRAEFQATSDAPTLRRGLAIWGAATGVTVVAGTVGVEAGAVIRALASHSDLYDRYYGYGHYQPYGHYHRHGQFSISWGRALQATAERMIGVYHVHLPPVMDRFFDPAMAAVSVALGLVLAIILFRPVVVRGRYGGRPNQSDLARARDIVSRHGSGTLDYFALRPDKQFFFWGDTVTAYAVYGGVCLVSPDPIGPVPEREAAWRAFRRFVDEHGWALGGLGAGEDWLPIYRATGMHDL